MTDLASVAAAVPDHWSAYTTMVASIRSDPDLDPVIFELCRLQAARRLGCESELAFRYQPAVEAGLTEEKVKALPSCHHSPLFSERERACLRFAEQFEMDPHSITDDDFESLTHHMPGGSDVAFVPGPTALGMTSRIRLVAAAAQVRATIGSRAGSWGAIGDGGTWGSGRTTCSPTHTDSKPAASADVARPRDLQGCSGPPMPMEGIPSFTVRS